MTPEKSEDLVRAYGAVLASEEKLARRVSLLPTTKGEIRLAFLVYGAYLRKNGLLNDQLKDALVSGYAALETFVDDEKAEILNRTLSSIRDASEEERQLFLDFSSRELTALPQREEMRDFLK